MNEPREKIAQANQRLISCLKSGQASEVASLYTSDGQLLPPNQPIISGPEAITAFWARIIQLGIRDAQLETVELHLSPGAAIEIGRFTLKSADGQVWDDGKYMVFWREQDGQWKLHRDIWNSNRKPA